MQKIKIDTSQMSNIEKVLLASSLLEGVQRHFENPENRKRFEVWKRKRANSFLSHSPQIHPKSTF